MSRLRVGRKRPPIDPMGASAAGPRAARPVTSSFDDDPLPRRKLVFFIVAVGLFIVSVDQTIVATALSTIQHDLHAGIEWSGWTITIYSLGQILVMPLAGKLSDQFGRKKIFLVSVIVFTAASLGCGLASNIYLLVGLRALQAIGGSGFMPSATGIVADHFGRNRDRALGMFASILPIGGIVGPILGGVFVTDWSWRGIFLINVPMGVALALLCLLFIPRGLTQSGRKVDVLGIVLLGIGMLSGMFGVTNLGSGASALSFWFIGPEVLAAVALVLFLFRTKYAVDPFIPLRLLRGRGFGAMNFINFLYGGAALGFGALVPLYAYDRFDIPLLQAGTLLTARAIGMICVAGLAVVSLRRTGYRIPMILGLLILAAGLAATALTPVGATPYLWLSVAGAVTGIGMGLAVPASNNAAMQLAPEDLSGIAGLRGMFRQSGAIVAISITTAFVARSHDPGGTLAVSFVVFAVMLVCVLPLIRLVPEHRGSW
jgi:EmrB/QacA subfamily drug resistance transporter